LTPARSSCRWIAPMSFCVRAVRRRRRRSGTSTKRRRWRGTPSHGR
jgi:hypothetical protein